MKYGRAFHSIPAEAGGFLSAPWNFRLKPDAARGVLKSPLPHLRERCYFGIHERNSPRNSTAAIPHVREDWGPIENRINRINRKSSILRFLAFLPRLISVRFALLFPQYKNILKINGIACLCGPVAIKFLLHRQAGIVKKFH